MSQRTFSKPHLNALVSATFLSLLLLGCGESPDPQQEADQLLGFAEKKPQMSADERRFRPKDQRDARDLPRTLWVKGD
jgi:hypothetical protein